ncbi:MAG TPA: hypothetical protein VH500_19770 [Nitrososphaeraceae archaeon]|jgi:hypothetical protein
MGAVFRPKDLPSSWRKMARESIKDLSPDTKDNVLKIIESWEGDKSEAKLEKLLGRVRAEDLMKKIARETTKSKDTLTLDQRNQVMDMFRDSLTFD